jgi:uncharacterized repeat protein (TIGR03803 family)
MKTRLLPASIIAGFLIVGTPGTAGAQTGIQPQGTGGGPCRTLPPAYAVLHTFTGGADGANPNNYVGDLVRGPQGDLYGVATNGGVVGTNCSSGCGVVFKLDRAGRETVLHTFAGSPDGASPSAALVLDGDGNLFGTTVSGGNSGFGAGTVFKINRFGKETVLYSFSGGTDGNAPYAGVIRDHDGTLYGTTQGGGSSGAGIVYKLDRDGDEKVLYNFTGGADGGEPGNLLLDRDQTLYGTTQAGGASGAGVVYKLSQAGSQKVLYSFTGGPDGRMPGDLIRDTWGNFLGTTSGGGSGTGNCGFFGGCGVVFKLTPQGKETVLYTFEGGTDGSLPYGRLLLDGSHLFGTSLFGGDPDGCIPFGCGVVYRLDTTGMQTVLYSFTGGADGGNPYSGLIAGDNGVFYGTTGYGGDLASTSPACGGIGCGVAFKLSTSEECDIRSAAADGTTPPATGKAANYVNLPPLGRSAPRIWTVQK